MKKQTISLKRDLILIKEIPPDEKTSGGIFLPQIRVKDIKVQHWTVLEVGPKVQEIKVGDKITTEHPMGVSLRFNGEEVLIMRERNVLGVLE